jgi:phage repressor protein C with HTH and peptisase S24 domain
VIDLNGIFERLSKLYGVSQLKELSVALGYNHNWAAGTKKRGGIPYEACAKAAEEFNVSLDFLVYGREKNTLPTDQIQIPFYEVTAAAGCGSLVLSEEMNSLVSFDASFLRNELHVDPKQTFLMLVRGDSMTPTLNNNAVMMVSREIDGFSDGIYVIRMDGSLIVKGLQVIPNGIIKVISDNKDYQTYEINKKDFESGDYELIGRVVWSGQRM